MTTDTVIQITKWPGLRRCHLYIILIKILLYLIIIFSENCIVFKFTEGARITERVG